MGMNKILTGRHTNRAIHIDALRIFACLMVIFNHSNKRGFYRYAINDIHSVSWIWDTFFSAMCKVGVPIFFMIAGANLLGKQESVRKTFSRTRRIALCLVFWSMVYFYLDSLPAGAVFSFKESVKKMIGGSYWHLWYLYSYIAFLFTVPLLRKLCRNIGCEEFYLVMAIGVVMLIAMPIVENFFLPISKHIKPSWVIADIFFYPVIGWYIDKRFDRITWKQIIALWCLNIGNFILSLICEQHYLVLNPGDRNEVFLRISCLINAVTIFATAKYIFSRSQDANRYHKTGWLISEIGRLTFGIYLTHIIFLWKIPFLMTLYKRIEAEYMGIGATVALVFVIAGMVTFAFEKIPIVREVL